MAKNNADKRIIPDVNYLEERMGRGGQTITTEQADAVGDSINQLDTNNEELMMIGSASETGGSAFNYYDRLRVGSDNSFQPFSYQKKAVKDFIYKFSRKGILSDQVGMGKTIEAGMIISELACRQELRSLLIIVPSATMVYKWEKELSDKFGLRTCYTSMAVDGKKVDANAFPSIVTVNNEDDIDALLFDVLDEMDMKDIDYFPGVNFNDMVQKAFESRYERIRDKIYALAADILAENTTKFGVRQLCRAAVKFCINQICEQFAADKRAGRGGWNKCKEAPPTFENYEEWESAHPVDQDGEYTLICDYLSDNMISGGRSYAELLSDKELLGNSLLAQFNFYKCGIGRKMRESVAEWLSSRSHSETEKRVMLCEIATRLKRNTPIMIISNEKEDGVFWLGKVMFRYCDPALQYMFKPEVAAPYTFFDLLIDMHFSTLIVDEAHNYIDVHYKNPEDYKADSICREYHMFELFPRDDDESKYDQYLLRRSCLYAKLLSLSNHTRQKIFMTATPIKSDMIDFYLLNLLRGRRDSELDYSLYNVTRQKQVLNYEVLPGIASRLMDYYGFGGKEAYNYINRIDFVCMIISEMKQTLFQNNAWDSLIAGNRLESNTMREVAMDIILQRINTANTLSTEDMWSDFAPQPNVSGADAYRRVLEEGIKVVLNVDAMRAIVKNIINKEKEDFEKKFTDNNGPIKTIQALVNSPDGMEEWRNRYSNLGIRTTRHQTNQLSGFWTKLFAGKKASDYNDLPVWSRRNGMVINICREDRYFDYVARINMNRMVAVLDADAAQTEARRAAGMDADIVEHLSDIDKWLSDPANRNMSETELQKQLARYVYKNWWKGLNVELNQKLRGFASQYDEQSVEYKTNARLARRDFKRKIAHVLYADVIDRGMRAECLDYNYVINDFPDYLEGRMHLLISIILDELEKVSFNKSTGFARVLVFANEQINEQLYKLLQQEAEYKPEKLGRPSDRDDYKYRYAHKPFMSAWNKVVQDPHDRWVISDSISALKETKDANVLVIVPPGKYEEGVDLQQATHLVNFDILHSPLAMEQRIGRIDRVKPKNTIESRDIYVYAFTPLNDWSGYTTAFMAKYLHLFNRWNGDTTGIVSFPVSDQVNSSTFESIVKKIEEAYRILSDHTEGEAVRQMYNEVSALLLQLNDNNVSAICKKIRACVEDMRFEYQYSDNGELRYTGRMAYHGAPDENYASLADHIERQAQRLQQCFKTLNKIFLENIFRDSQSTILQDTFVELSSQPFRMSELIDDDVSGIIEDLTFLYYQHCFFDIIGNNVDMYNGIDDLTEAIPERALYYTQNRGKASPATYIYNTLTAYVAAEVFPDKRANAGVQSRVRSTGGSQSATSTQAEVPYPEQIKAQNEAIRSMHAYRKLLNGGTEGELGFNMSAVFGVYDGIVNKYIQHLLCMYVYLCRQVKKRLDEMARIIEDGAIEDLMVAIADDIPRDFIRSLGV